MHKLYDILYQTMTSIELDHFLTIEILIYIQSERRWKLLTFFYFFKMNIKIYFVELPGIFSKEIIKNQIGNFITSLK